MYLEERVKLLEEELDELKKQKKEEQYKSLKQLAVVMGCTDKHISNLIERGEIKAIRLGKIIRIPMSQFDVVGPDSSTDMKKKVFG